MIFLLEEGLFNLHPYIPHRSSSPPPDLNSPNEVPARYRTSYSTIAPPPIPTSSKYLTESTSHLPNEILFRIFGYLDNLNLVPSLRVTKQFHDLIGSLIYHSIELVPYATTPFARRARTRETGRLAYRRVDITNFRPFLMSSLKHHLKVLLICPHGEVHADSTPSEVLAVPIPGNWILKVPLSRHSPWGKVACSNPIKCSVIQEFKPKEIIIESSDSSSKGVIPDLQGHAHRVRSDNMDGMRRMTVILRNYLDSNYLMRKCVEPVLDKLEDLKIIVLPIVPQTLQGVKEISIRQVESELTLPKTMAKMIYDSTPKLKTTIVNAENYYLFKHCPPNLPLGQMRSMIDRATIRKARKLGGVQAGASDFALAIRWELENLKLEEAKRLEKHEGDEMEVEVDGNDADESKVANDDEAQIKMIILDDMIVDSWSRVKFINMDNYTRTDVHWRRAISIEAANIFSKERSRMSTP